MSVLQVRGLHASVAGTEVLHGVDLEIRSGEVHAVMGPNGAGKSTLGNVLLGRPGYTATAGSVTLDGLELLGLPTWERARAGLFLAPQDPTEVPGVPLGEVMVEALPTGPGVRSRLLAEARAIGVDEQLLERGLNVGASGGERKRLETLQLAVLRPRFAVLDEIDSGLDVDALGVVARRLEAETGELAPVADWEGGRHEPLGVLVITHYRRVLEVLRADVVHVLVEGRIVQRGGPELAEELEQTGYAEHHRPDDDI